MRLPGAVGAQYTNCCSRAGEFLHWSSELSLCSYVQVIARRSKGSIWGRRRFVMPVDTLGCLSNYTAAVWARVVVTELLGKLSEKMG